MMLDPNADRRPPKQNAPSRRGNAVVLIAVALLAGLLLWTVSAIQKHNAVQNCVDSGRRDCLTLPTD